jgi:molybdopterin-containing oxidoreductase family membrane subunit
MKHLENCAKVMLATGLMVVYGYFMEVFTAWYSGNIYERYMQFESRMGEGPYAWAYWSLLFVTLSCRRFCGSRNIAPTDLSVRGVDCGSIGMWLERFVIIVVSLSRDFLPEFVGELPADFLGLGVVRRHLRPVPDAVPVVHTRFAPDCGR